MNTAQPIKDMSKLTKLMEVYEYNTKNHMLLSYALNTGLRISDILRANVSDSLEGYWKDREQKTNKEKIIRLSDSLIRVIEDYVEVQGLEEDDYLFYSNKNPKKPIHRSQAHRIIANAGDMIGLTLSAHSLRKTFGYVSYKKGVDISLLMEVFNHSSVATTLKYIGQTQDEIDNVYLNTRIGI